MTLIEYLEPVLNYLLDISTEGMSTRSFENLLRWEIEKEICKPAFGNIDVSSVTLFETNRDGERAIMIDTYAGRITGQLKMNCDKGKWGRWELVSGLCYVNVLDV